VLSKELVVFGKPEGVQCHISATRVEAGGGVCLRLGEVSVTIVRGPRNGSDSKTRFTYRRGVVRRLPQAFTVAEDERGILIILVNRALRLILRVVVGKNAVGLRTGGRLEGFSLRVERTQVHGGRNQDGDWG